MKNGITVLVAAAAFALLAADVARAFELERVDGNPCGSSQFLSWSNATTEFSVESLDDTTGPIAREEAQAWNDNTSFTLSEATQHAFCDQSDHVVSMGFANQLCDGSAFANDVLAITEYRFTPSSGRFVSAEIVFNTAASLLDDADTFRHVCLHEMGHVLGLGHSDSCGGSGDNSVMKAVLRSTDPRFRVPGSDDIAGADFIYGTDTPTPTSTPVPQTPSITPTPGTPSPSPASGSSGSAGGGGGCSLGPDGGNALPVLLLCGLALAVRARRRMTVR